MDSDLRKALRHEASGEARHYPADIERAVRKGRRGFVLRLVLVNSVALLGALLVLGAIGVYAVGAGQDDSADQAVNSRLVIAPAELTLEPGTSQQLSALGSYSDGSSRDVTDTVAWQSNDEAVATVDAAGVATAVGGGTTIITATSDNEVEASARVTVTAQATEVTSLSVSPEQQTIDAGTTVELVATATFSDQSSREVTESAVWASDNEAVADVDDTGVVTAKTDGTAIITATTENGVEGSASVTVKPQAAELTQVSVSPQKQTIDAGTTLELTATGTFSDGSSGVITGSVRWTSDNEAVADVDDAGIVTAGTGGSAVITATADDGVSGSANVTVRTESQPQDDELTSVSVSPEEETLIIGASRQFTATGTYSDGSSADLTGSVKWLSSDTQVVRVDADGIVTAETQGFATLTAEAENGVRGSTRVIVDAPAPELTQIAIERPDDAETCPPNETLQLAVTGTYADGSTADLTDSVTWTTSDGADYTVSAIGLVSPHGEGAEQIAAVITAKAGSLSDSTKVSCTPVARFLVPSV